MFGSRTPPSPTRSKTLPPVYRNETKSAPTLLDIGDALLQESDMKKVAHRLIQHLKESMNAETGCLYFMDQKTPPLFKGLKQITEYTLKTKAIVNLSDFKSSLLYEATQSKIGECRIKTLLASPLPCTDSTNACIVLINKLDRAHRVIPFTQADEKSLGMFAVLFGMTLSKHAACEKLHRNLDLRKELFYYYGAILPEQLKAYQTTEARLLAAPDCPTLTSIQKEDFDAHIYEATDDRLCIVFKLMFKDLKLGVAVTEEELTRYILTVRRHYRCVPYHNFTHAISVTHGIYTLLKIYDISSQLTDLERFALFIAAVNHDIDHRGRNNDFQKNAATLLASVYTTSTMERHHYHHTLDILHIAGDFIIKSLHEKDKIVFMEKLECAILATDLKLHMGVREQLKEIIKGPGIQFEHAQHRPLILSLMMTCSDLISMTKPWENHQKTCCNVYSEFFLQGDEEKQLGLDLSSELVDRHKTQRIPTMQVGFQKFIVHPAFELLAQIFPSTQYLFDCAKENTFNWAQLEKSEMTFYFIPLGGFSQRKEITLDTNVTNPISISIGRLMEGLEPSRHALKFPSKVVSRQHAMLWLVDKKLYVQDTKSSSGTFLNSLRLSPQGIESAQIELHDGDVIKLGEDCEVSGVLFGEASLQRYETGVEVDTNNGYVDYSFDPKVQAIVDVEFDAIWDSLTSGLDDPLKRLQALKKGEHVISIKRGKIFKTAPHLVIDTAPSWSGNKRGSMASNASSKSKKSDLVTPIHTATTLLNRSNSRGSPSTTSPWRGPYSPMSDSSGESGPPSGRPLSRQQSDGTNHYHNLPTRSSISNNSANTRRSPEPSNRARQQSAPLSSNKSNASSNSLNTPSSLGHSSQTKPTSLGFPRVGSNPALK